MILWQQSKYNVNEGGSSLLICAAPVGSLSGSVTVTNVMVEDRTAIGKDCLQIPWLADSGFYARGVKVVHVHSPSLAFQKEFIYADK